MSAHADALDAIRTYHARDRALEADGAITRAERVYRRVGLAGDTDAGFAVGDDRRVLAVELDQYARERIEAVRAELQAEARAFVRGELEAAARRLQAAADGTTVA